MHWSVSLPDCQVEWHGERTQWMCGGKWYFCWCVGHMHATWCSVGRHTVHFYVDTCRFGNFEFCADSLSESYCNKPPTSLPAYYIILVSTRCVAVITRPLLDFQQRIWTSAACLNKDNCDSQHRFTLVLNLAGTPAIVITMAIAYTRPLLQTIYTPWTLTRAYTHA